MKGLLFMIAGQGNGPLYSCIHGKDVVVVAFTNRAIVLGSKVK